MTAVRETERDKHDQHGRDGSGHTDHAADRSAELWSPSSAVGHRQLLPHHSNEANDVIMLLVHSNVNRALGQPPGWVDETMRNPNPRVQCASTASNLYRAALMYAHIVTPNDERSYRPLEQVLVSKWVESMTGARLAVEIPRSQIKPGDAVVGEYDLNVRHGRNADRHVGFVGDYDARTNRWSAYSNSMGHLRLQDLDERFGHYREQHYYRLYFPR